MQSNKPYRRLLEMPTELGGESKETSRLLHWVRQGHDRRKSRKILRGNRLIRQRDKTIDARGASVHIANGAGITIQFVKNVFLFGALNDYVEDEKMQVTVAFNHFGKGLVQRMPRARYGFIHVVNNDYTHWLMFAIGGSQHPIIISQGNDSSLTLTISQRR
ncbi:unnamed protein product [Amaranthus hypochondriacus]